MRKRGAFLDNFRREDMFKDDLSELDESREVVDNLVQEYEAATQANYLSWEGRLKFIHIRLVSSYIFKKNPLFFYFTAKKPAA